MLTENGKENVVKFAKVLYSSDKAVEVVPIENVKLFFNKNNGSRGVIDFHPENVNDFEKIKYIYAVEKGKDSLVKHYRTASILLLAGKSIIIVNSN